MAKGFNLNLLECKARTLLNVCIYRYSFNLNLLECKEYIPDCITYQVSVLISTYWNVKNDIDELRDPEWWGFNLNLLECKAVTFVVTGAAPCGFNLNLLECKDIFC